MDNEQLIGFMSTIIILATLLFGILGKYDNKVKQNRINELENKVEEQYYLIDALKQQEE